MCGIVGALQDPQKPLLSLEILTWMSNRLQHRGPDDAGLWSDPERGVFLGHRRLSILDLSDAGHQPMVSRTARYVIVFNGEIYNHRALRDELEDGPWRGHSDTETLLACVEAWGLENTLRRCVGMFALALWDRDACLLFLARDRVGEKPLYYGWVRGALVFSSELKAIREVPGFDNPVERKALALFMRHNCVPSPWSIYENVWKLPPGSLASFKVQDIAPGSRGSVRSYWSARGIAQRGVLDGFQGDDSEAVRELDRLLRQSVADQMIADVPLGAFLSGGLDSSTVAAMMQSLSTCPVQTFTVGFHERGYDEARHARTIARHLGTDHTELYVSAAETLDIIPRLPEMFDEPFADSSQIPTFLVAQLARRHVTVALSGDGGDELFGGYNRYLWGLWLWRRGQGMHASVRRLLSSLLVSVSPSQWNHAAEVVQSLLPARLRFGNPGDKIHKIGGMIGADDPETLYRGLVSHWNDPAQVVLGSSEPATPVTDPGAWLDCPDPAQRMMYLDLITYLPDDILVKLDRTAMAVSLETRVPFLDYRLVEFAWRLPLSMKIRHGKGKWVLREVLRKYVPEEMFERPKMGFAIPLDAWLRGPLREWAENLLCAKRLHEEGYFDPSQIRRKWLEHLSGRRNWQYLLWDVLVFQAWMDRWK